ncbi:MAG: GTP cyclohydrolase I FolE [bacterium]
MEKLFRQLIEELGEDIHRQGLQETPQRAAEALRFLTQGYRQDLDAIVKDGLFDTDTTEMIVVKDIELYSLCEHHLLPFFGKCQVGYLPDGKVMGLSKVARIVDVFARRLQIQERLTRQVADTIVKYTGAAGVGVIIEAQHLCMTMRGVRKQNSLMTTSCMLGQFHGDPAARSEFLSLVK